MSMTDEIKKAAVEPWTVPIGPGYFWAQWHENRSHQPDNDPHVWGIVHVVVSEHGGLVVLAPGISRYLSLDEFTWGTGPLDEPHQD